MQNKVIMFCCRISPFIVFFSSLNYPTVWISICFSKDLPIKEFIRQKHYGCNLNLLPISATISHSLFSTRHTDPLNVFYSLSLSLSLSLLYFYLSLSLYIFISLFIFLSFSLFLSLSLSLSLSKCWQNRKRVFATSHFHTRHLSPGPCITCLQTSWASVTRLDNLLHLGQLFKACGCNYFAKIAHMLRQFL